MWERTSGVASNPCHVRHARLKATGRDAIRLGDDWRTLLKRAGQPQQRDRAWSWCVNGKGNRHAADVAVLSKAGVVELVGSTALKHRAFGLVVGGPAKGNGLQVQRRAGRAFVALVRGGIVRAVAVTTTKLASDKAALRAAMRRVTTAKADSTPRKFVPAPKQAEGRMLGRALAETGNPSVDAKLALLCNLNL
jgi:hypothetical protein